VKSTGEGVKKAAKLRGEDRRTNYYGETLGCHRRERPQSENEQEMTAWGIGGDQLHCGKL